MKKVVKMVTAICFVLILLGGSALDSKNLFIPMMMIVPGLVWFGLIAWANR